MDSSENIFQIGNCLLPILTGFIVLVVEYYFVIPLHNKSNQKQNNIIKIISISGLLILLPFAAYYFYKLWPLYFSIIAYLLLIFLVIFLILLIHDHNYGATFQFIKFYYYYFRSKYDDSLDVINEIVEKRPEDAYPLSMKASVYKEIGEHHLAFESISKALSIEVNSLAMLNKKQDILEKWIDDDPDNKIISGELASTLEEKIILDPNKPDYFHLAFMYFHSQNNSLGLKKLREFIDSAKSRAKEDEENLSFYLAHKNLVLLVESLIEIIDFLNESLPNNSFTKHHRVPEVVSIKIQNIAHAIQELDVSSNKTIDVNYQLSELLFDLGEYNASTNFVILSSQRYLRKFEVSQSSIFVRKATAQLWRLEIFLEDIFEILKEILINQ